MVDKYIKHSQDDYAEVISQLLPQGDAWPRDPDGVDMQVIQGLAGPWGNDIANSVDILLRIESFPPFSINMLTDWETSFGLPDPCWAPGHTIDERHNILAIRMTMVGAQSRAFFIYVASLLGYTITITEYAPFMCGVSECGDAWDDQGYSRWEIGPEEIRYYWNVHVSALSLTWFRVSTGQVGVDPHLRFGIADDLECLLNRWKPAHTTIIFDYSTVAPGGALAGTP